ncbi:hypothetical protein QJR30_07225 [Paraclostridium sordellii]|uniref:hypothetical protein n=1 Tax=Paraclostridium sordellii TaxID=1505 RepID=UPI0005DA6997|nr:hypothetical protein [Paeniclostridium sordellii]CEP80296.1 Uncharacterised protein [[Clostridium] sordellii] [Paeniclostridium sordellii]
MKIITFRWILTLLGLRFVYINIYNVPFSEQVFICTSIGFTISQILVEIFFNKSKKYRN